MNKILNSYFDNNCGCEISVGDKLRLSRVKKDAKWRDLDNRYFMHNNNGKNIKVSFTSTINDNRENLMKPVGYFVIIITKIEEI